MPHSPGVATVALVASAIYLGLFLASGYQALGSEDPAQRRDGYRVFRLLLGIPITLTGAAGFSHYLLPLFLGQ